MWRLLSTVGDSFSTMGNSFSTVEVVQYSGGTKSVHTGGQHQYCGWYSVVWRVSFSTVEGFINTVGG